MSSVKSPNHLPKIDRTPLGLDGRGRMQHRYDLSSVDDWAKKQGYNAENPIQIVRTGPESAGLVQLSDGTLYDVTPHYIIVASPEHAHEIHHHIGEQHQEAARFDNPLTGELWQHTDCAHCDVPDTLHEEDVRVRNQLARTIQGEIQAARASAAGENAATNGLTAVCSFLALFTADPTTSGATGEVSGGSYARQSITWGTSASGTATNTNAPAVPIPASTTVTHFGLFTLVSAGVYEIGGVLGSSLTTGASPATVTFAAAAVSLGSS